MPVGYNPPPQPPCNTTYYGRCLLLQPAFGTWTYHGLAVSALTSRGLHLEQPSNGLYKPSLCSEFKRWLFGSIFANDKVHSSFSGHPPLLASRFCTTPLPSDLGSEELLGNPEELQNAASKLDEHGWSTGGQLHPAGVGRIRMAMSFIMEDIVNIALSHSSIVTLAQLE